MLHVICFLSHFKQTKDNIRIRFKDDVKEVAKGYDCGLQIKNYNDIVQGDVIEAYKEVAVKKKLK